MTTFERLIQGLELKSVGQQINSANFPEGEYKAAKSYELIEYPSLMTADLVLEDMKKKKLQPACMFDLLHWGQDQWDGLDFVVALDCDYLFKTGSKELPSVPALLFRGSFKGKSLALDSMAQVWQPGTKFLAVRRGK